MDIKGELNKFDLNTENSVVIGSGILDAIGIRESRDIDIIVNEETYNRLSSDKRFEKGKNHIGREILKNNLFEIGASWHVIGADWNFNNFLPESIIIDGVRYITIDFLLKIKKSWVMNDKEVRQKDIEDIKLIQSYLNKL